MLNTQLSIFCSAHTEYRTNVLLFCHNFTFLISHYPFLLFDWNRIYRAVCSAMALFLSFIIPLKIKWYLVLMKNYLHEFFLSKLHIGSSFGQTSGIGPVWYLNFPVLSVIKMKKTYIRYFRALRPIFFYQVCLVWSQFSNANNINMLRGFQIIGTIIQRSSKNQQKKVVRHFWSIILFLDLKNQCLK